MAMAALPAEQFMISPCYNFIGTGVYSFSTGSSAFFEIAASLGDSLTIYSDSVIATIASMIAIFILGYPLCKSDGHGNACGRFH